MYDKVLLLPRKPQNPKDFHDLQDILNRRVDDIITRAFGTMFRLSGATVSIDSNKVVHVNGYFYLGGRLYFIDQTADASAAAAATGGSLVNVYVDVTEEETTFEDDPSIALKMPNTGQYVETSVRHEFVPTVVAPVEDDGPHSAPANGWTYLIAQVNVDTYETTQYTHEMSLFLPEATETINKIFIELKDSNGDTYLTSSNAINENAALHKLFTQGLIDFGDGAGDRKIITEPLPPKNPLNIRIKNIELLTTEVDEAELQILAHDFQKQIMSSAVVRTTIGWGYDDIVGDGDSTGNVTVTNLSGITEDQLVGYQFTTNGVSYKIVGNQATDADGNTVISVKNEFNVAPDLSSVTLTTDSPGYIHSAAQHYILRAIPYINGNYEHDKAYTKVIGATQGADGLTGTLELPIGLKFLFQVRAINVDKTSAWTDMQAGSWTDSGGTTYNYDVPTLIKLPNLLDDNTTQVSITPSKNGILVDINGWANATEFEYGWKELSDGADSTIDFINPSAGTAIKRTTLRNFEVIINDPAQVSIAVRPLQAGQVVGTTHSSVLQTGGLAPSKPLNIKVHDIAPLNVDVDSTMIDKIARGQSINQIDKRANVIIKWGYTSSDGTGAYDTTNFGTVTLRDIGTIQENELVDQLIYVTNLHKNYYIWKNDATDADGNTLIYIRNLDNTEATDAGSILVDEQNTALIYPDADSYIGEAYEVQAGEIIKSQGPAVTVQSSMRIDSLIPNAMSLPLLLGKTYRIYVKAVKDKRQSDPGALESGTLTRVYQGSLLTLTDGTVKTYDYSSDLLVKMIDFVGTNYDDGSVAVQATYSGFRITISGWNFASAFEIGYAKNGYIDFNNPGDGQIAISQNRSVDIPTASGGTYYVTVRPLDGWQVSGTPFNVQTSAGAGGSLPMEQVILAKDVDLVTYSGTLAVIDPGVSPDWTTIAQLKDANDNVIIDPAMKNKVLTDVNDHDFRIIAADNTGTLKLVPLNNDAYAADNGAATIGTSEEGRRIYYAPNMNTDYVITRIAFVCNHISLDSRPTPGTIRIYQVQRLSGADYITFNASGRYTQETDVDIVANNGPRDLVVDAYNPDIGGTKTQLTSFSGQLTIYGVPKKLVEI